MRINFLAASDGTSLSKSFEEIAPGTYKETSYPHVTKFNSVERIVTTPLTLYQHVTACADEGLCLLKGMLDRPILDESRAGHTDSSAPTSWLCLDVDYTVVGQTPRQWLTALSTEFEDVGFVFQYSASHKVSNNLPGWRGHFFVLLDSLQSPQVLKQWLIQKNLACISLQPHIGLSASGGALTYPLDITTCQNDKLLYIAPPTCLKFDDPVTNRFELHEGTPTAHLQFNVSAAANQLAIRKLIDKQRKLIKLEKKVFKIVQKGGNELMLNPDPVTVTGKKEARDFVYLNLNGGDSWAYFFPLDNPEILYNFKGEPCMQMQDVDKDIYNEYRTVPTHTSGNFVPFGFLWPNDDSYYRGFASRETGELAWIHSIGSKGKLRDFYVQHGEIPPAGWVVAEWQMTFDPSTEGKVDFANQMLNTYKRTHFMINATQGTHIPPTIDRILTSVCVNEETKAHFLNWLSAIFQTRTKTNTAWIFQGVQGTGKGVLLTRIIAPLIGTPYCHEMTMDRLDDDFNAYLGENIILFIDEAKITDSHNGARLLNRIKNLVTEPEQHIRGMRRNAVTRTNYSNVILASNYDEIIPLEISDRRFNVAPRQEKSIQLDYDDIVTIEGELPDFANFLHSYAVDSRAVKKVLLSAARDQLIELSNTTVDCFFHAIKNGDLAYFTQFIDNSIKPDIEGIRYHDYMVVIKRWIDNDRVDGCHITRDEMRACYQYLQGANISASKFSRMCKRYGMNMTSVRIDGDVRRGLPDIQWVLADEERALFQESSAKNVVAFR